MGSKIALKAGSCLKIPAKLERLQTLRAVGRFIMTKWQTIERLSVVSAATLLVTLTSAAIADQLGMIRLKPNDYGIAISALCVPIGLGITSMILCDREVRRCTRNSQKQQASIDQPLEVLSQLALEFENSDARWTAHSNADQSPQDELDLDFDFSTEPSFELTSLDRLDHAGQMNSIRQLALGDISCKFNARSLYIQCAVNPNGDCATCSLKQTAEN
jgi:hypothetical protein